MKNRIEIPREGDITTIRELIAVLETLPPSSNLSASLQGLA